MNSIAIDVSLARDLWNIIHKAKHPHFESEIIELVKSTLAKKIQDACTPKQEENVDPV